MWIKEIIYTTSLEDIESLEKQKRILWSRYLKGQLLDGKKTLNLLQEIINDEKKSFAAGDCVSYLKYESSSKNS